jgi:phosphatidylinositol glycan class M
VLCTRGSSDAITNFLVFSMIRRLQLQHYGVSGVIYGVLVHFRIYPVIYSTSFFWYILFNGGNKSNHDKWNISLLNHDIKHNIHFLTRTVYPLLSFYTNAFIGFFSLTLVCWFIYGNQYVDNAIFYHLIRTDFKHNFSFSFYSNYLNHSTVASNIISTLQVQSNEMISKIVMFSPQILLINLIGFLYAKNHLYLCMLLQTMIFVTYNKVVTAQYFVWYILFTPLVIAQEKVDFHYILHMNNYIRFLVISWVISLLSWLYYAYLLEYEGVNTFRYIWLASQGFFWSNIVIICSIIFWKPSISLTDFRDTGTV